MYEAQRAGADWCSSGWVKDSTNAMYPSNWNIQTGCGNGGPGIREWISDGGRAAVNCYGVKPPEEAYRTDAKGGNEIAPWTSRNGNGKPAWYRREYKARTGPQEVFHVSGPLGNEYNIKRPDAEFQCAKYGAKLATRAQVYEAQRGGADWCSTGWVADSSGAMYPSNWNTQTGCGNGRSAVIEWTSPSGYAAANCYGVKPPSEPYPDNVGNMVLPWTSRNASGISAWYQSDYRK